MEPIARKARNYLDAAGKSPFRKWIRRKIDGELRNRSNVRIRRIEEVGDYGGYEPVGEGVYELRFDVGPGYRVYFGIDGSEMMAGLQCLNAQATFEQIFLKIWLIRKRPLTI